MGYVVTFAVLYQGYNMVFTITGAGYSDIFYPISDMTSISGLKSLKTGNLVEKSQSLRIIICFRKNVLVLTSLSSVSMEHSRRGNKKLN
jgi:hypothetical protein